MRNYRSLKVWDHSISFVIFYSGMGGFPGATMLKNPPANTEDSGDESSIPGSGRSLGGRNGKLLQYSCLENFMDLTAWWATVHGVTKSQTQLSD